MSWRRVVHLVELARAELLLAAVSNVWLMTFLAGALAPPGGRGYGIETVGVWPTLGLGTLAAMLLVGSAVALNDVLDARHDRAFAPSRPIPSGRVRRPLAVSLAVLSLLGAVVAALPLGRASSLIVVLTAGGMLFYNLTGRFVPAVGVVSLGLITGLLMLIPDPRPELAWPVVLAMTHVMACATLRHWLAGKRPRLSQADGWGICVGWAFWTLVVVGLMHERGAGAAGPWVWVGPSLGIVVFVGATVGLLRGRLSEPRSRLQAGQRFARWSWRWLIVYSAGWLVSAGLWVESGMVAGLLILAIAAQPVATWAGLASLESPRYRSGPAPTR